MSESTASSAAWRSWHEVCPELWCVVLAVGVVGRRLKRWLGRRPAPGTELKFSDRSFEHLSRQVRVLVEALAVEACFVAPVAIVAGAPAAV